MAIEVRQPNANHQRPSLPDENSERRHRGVDDFVAVRAPRVHKIQQPDTSVPQSAQLKALVGTRFQHFSTSCRACFGSRGSGVRIPPPRPSQAMSYCTSGSTILDSLWGRPWYLSIPIDVSSLLTTAHFHSIRICEQRSNVMHDRWLVIARNVRSATPVFSHAADECMAHIAPSAMFDHHHSKQPISMTMVRLLVPSLLRSS